MSWYFAKDGQRSGPVSEQQLRELIRLGGVDASALVWTPGMPAWAPIAASFADAFPATPAVAPALPQAGRAHRPFWPWALLCAAACAAAGYVLAALYRDIALAAHPRAHFAQTLAAALVFAALLFGSTVVAFLKTPSPVARMFSMIYAVGGTLVLAAVAAFAPPLGKVAAATEHLPRFELEAADGDAPIRLDGMIAPGIVQKFRRVLDAAPQARRIVVSSRGGLLKPALAMARMIVERHLDVEIRHECASACLLLLMAGQHRYADAGANFGFHSPGTVIRLSPWMQFVSRQSDADYYDYLAQHGMPQHYLDLARKTPAEKISLVDAVELAEAGVLDGILVDGKAISVQEAKWRSMQEFLGASRRPAERSAAIWWGAVLASGHRAVAQFADPVYQAIHAGGSSRIGDLAGQITGEVIDDALASADAASLTRYAQLQYRILRNLSGRQDWSACTHFFNADGKVGNAIPDDLKAALFDGMTELTQSAGAAQWRAAPVPPPLVAGVRQLAGSAALDVYALGFGPQDIRKNDRARCLFAIKLMDRVTAADGELPGLYLRALAQK